MILLQEALANLKNVHKNIQYEFSQLDRSTIDKYLGDYNSKALRDQLRRYGDGYVCHSIPKSIAELEAVDAIVFVAVTSPKLGETSDFDPTTPLHTIPYWREGKRLRTTATSEQSGREYRLHFLSWQQNFSIHGKDDGHARKNRRLLINQSRQLEHLFETETRLATEFVLCCSHWFRQNKQPFVVVTHSQRKTFSEPVRQLLASPNTRRVCANLRGTNHQIMPRIESVLP